MLRLPEHWVWDSWAIEHDGIHHLYFLKAPRSLGDPDLRHERAVIGHATSTDLIHWVERPDALHPSESGWDDLALWTGCVVRGDDGRWRMFYTALRSGGHGILDQRIGVAVSDDLDSWERVGDAPVVEPDGRWYRTLDIDNTASETWRDPFVFRDPQGDGWHMMLTARSRGGRRNEDAVIGHAWSADLESWTVLPPLSTPGGFGQTEVLQVREIDGACVLVFTCHPDEQSDATRERFGSRSTWSIVGESPLGPWELSEARPFEAEPDLFAAPLIRAADGRWVFVGFRNRAVDGVLPLELIDPVAVDLRGGALVAGEHLAVG